MKTKEKNTKTPVTANNQMYTCVGKEEIWLNAVRSRKECLEKLIAKKEDALRHAPEGHLRIHDKKSYSQYYWIKDSGDTRGFFIKKKNYNTARKLAQKDYDQRFIKYAKKEVKTISKYLECIENNGLTTVFDNLSDKRRVLVTPYISSDDIYAKEWMEEEYPPMGFDEKIAEFYSDSGLRVRSKTEIIIADMLEKNGIPFKYERPLYLKNWGTVRPDFTCLNVRTRKEYVWEHFGKMNDEDYATENIAKIHAYERNGFIMGSNMIMTFETSEHPINSNNIKLLIQKFLL